MLKIKRTEDLPEWFSLNNYDECNSFKAMHWLTNLRARRFLLELLADNDLDSVEKHAAKLREDPIDPFGFPWEPLPDSPVKSLSFNDLVISGGAIVAFNAYYPEKAELWIKMANRIAEGGCFLSDTAFDEPIGNAGLSHPVLVNLNASDSVLIEAFKSWLVETRSQKKASSKREKPAYSKWVQFGLLPYLDLLIWSEETGRSIPNHIMAHAVGYRASADSFRKNVPSLAKMLMADLSSLEALAAIEGEDAAFS